MVVTVEAGHNTQQLRPSGRPGSTARSSVRAAETRDLGRLTLWRRKLRGVEFALRAPQTSRPNPIVVDELLVASLWSPGAVVAVDRATGRQVWRHPFVPLAHDSIQFAEGMLYTHDLRALYGLEPGSGKTTWTWRPPEPDGELLHGSPTVARGRLFIGDQLGRFWCLDARTGEVIWRLEDAVDASPIHSTAAVVGGVVVFTTNEGLVMACDVRTGREVWREQLDGAASGEVLRLKDRLAIRTFWSVYLLDSKEGQIVHRSHWRGRYLRHLAATRHSVVITNQRAQGTMSMEPPSVLRASLAAEPGRLMIGLSEEGETFRQPCPPRLLALRWSPETGLLYESRADGLGILDPASGARLFELSSPGGWDSVYCGPVEVHDGVIYLLDLRGNLRALEHPRRANVRNIGGGPKTD